MWHSQRREVGDAPRPLGVARRDAAGGGGNRVRAFAGRRVCREPDCKTRLSVYNSGAYCARHDIGRVNGAAVAYQPAILLDPRWTEVGPQDFEDRWRLATTMGRLWLADSAAQAADVEADGQGRVAWTRSAQAVTRRSLTTENH